MSGIRTFVVKKPVMSGSDVKDWQHMIKVRFQRDFGIFCPIVIDGKYGAATRSFSAALIHAEGMSAGVKMKNGVTPELRKLIRENNLPKATLKIRNSKTRKAYREKLKKQWHQGGIVHSPVTRIITDSWGYHPGVHDGVDVITAPDVQAFAMIKCRVIDARSSGWWGLGAPSNAALKAKGDGIVQMEVLENSGPFKKGMHIAYGHCEKARVRVGQIVQAGEPVAHVGFANAWHIHLMVNNGKVGTRGIGNIDPRPLIDYAVKHG